MEIRPTGVMTPFTEAEEIKASQEMKKMAGKAQQVDPNEAATVIQKCKVTLSIIVKVHRIHEVCNSLSRI